MESNKEVNGVKPVISIKKKDPIDEFARNRAAKVIQKFYHSYIKTNRDPKTGAPIDPISSEPIEDKSHILRIIYEMYNPSKKQTICRVQYYDITTLWESFKYLKNNVAINPIVNTRFSKAHFKQILAKAIEVKLISAESKNQYMKLYGYDRPLVVDQNVSSAYEAQNSQNKAKFKQIYMDRLGSLLCYYALLNDYATLEKLVFLALQYEPNEDPRKSPLNYAKKIGEPLQRFPPDTLPLLKKQTKKLGFNPVYDNKIIYDSAIESSLKAHNVTQYTVFNALAYNQNQEALAFIMQFSPYLFNPLMKKTDPTALHMVLINSDVNNDIVDMLRPHYTDNDLDIQTDVGSIMDLVLLKLETNPELMAKFFG